MYTVTINFPTVKTPSVNGALSLKLSYDATGSNSTVYSDEVKLFVKDLGDIVTEHDVLDFLIIPTYLKPTFLDVDGYLFNLLTGIYPDSDTLNPRIEMNLTLSGAVSESFKVYLIEDTLDYDSSAKELKFDAAPQSDILNNTYLFDRDNSTPLNPFSLTNGEWIPLKQLLFYLFRLVRPDLEIEDFYFNHNLKFFGARTDNPLIKITDQTIDNIELPVSLLFFTEQRGNETAADLLRTIAASFFAIVGFKDGVTPFFVSMENTFTLKDVSTEKIINRRVNFSRPSPKYFKVNSIDNQTASISYGDTNVSDDFKLVQDIVYYANGWLRENGSSSYVNGFNFRLFRTWWDGMDFLTEYYHCHGVRDPLATIYADELEYEESPAMLLRKWRKYARSNTLNRVVEFDLVGVDSDFLQNYQIDGLTYRPISITRKLHENYTEFKGVPIVEG